jgi:hypothetical protein
VEIRCDREDPGFGAAFFDFFWQMMYNPKPSFLEKVLSLPRILRQITGKAINSRPVFLVQIIEFFLHGAV